MLLLMMEVAEGFFDFTTDKRKHFFEQVKAFAFFFLVKNESFI